MSDHFISIKFEVNFKEQNQEGLYEFRFYNCYSSLISNKEMDNRCPIDLSLIFIEKNLDSYLSAGEMPVPTLYLTWAILYFLAAISWIIILRSSK